MTDRWSGTDRDQPARTGAPAIRTDGGQNAAGDSSETGQHPETDGDSGAATADSPSAHGVGRPAGSDDTCPACGSATIPGSDECPSCGAVVDAGEGPSLELWGWAGGILAGFGIFLTPILAGPPALYCAWKIKEWKPRTARYIVIAVLGTVLFWLFLYPLIYISATG